MSHLIFDLSDVTHRPVVDSNVPNPYHRSHVTQPSSRDILPSPHEMGVYHCPLQSLVFFSSLHRRDRYIVVCSVLQLFT